MLQRSLNLRGCWDELVEYVLDRPFLSQRSLNLRGVGTLREQGLTQEEIAEKMGDDWSRSNVAQHISLLNNVVTGILNLARNHQEGRVTSSVTDVTFDFSEYWFRSSGIYDLHSEPEDVETCEEARKTTDRGFY